MYIEDGSTVLVQRDLRQHHAFGEIVSCLFPPPEYEHLIPCDGQTLDSEIHADLIQALGSNKAPNLNNRVLWGGDNVGTYIAAGLPNISGKIARTSNAASGTNFLSDSTGLSTSGALSVTYLKGILSMENTTTTGERPTGFTFDASNSNAIYGNSTTVQPPAFVVKFYICYKY